ncbi:MAG: hypothetical protein ACM3SX_01835 [Deltaproteobacteria bacterium]
MTTSTRSAMASGMLTDASGAGSSPPSVAIWTSGRPFVAPRHAGAPGS